MNEEEVFDLHPAPGAMKIARIAESGIKAGKTEVEVPERIQEIFKSMGGQIAGTIDLGSHIDAWVGAVVLEMGQALGGESPEWGEGDVVYFPVSAGMKVGDQEFLLISTPVAWRKG